MFIYPRMNLSWKHVYFSTGTIPTGIRELTNLQELYLGVNNLSGEESLQPYVVGNHQMVTS